MAKSGIGEPRGILYPRAGEKNFRLSRHAPSEDLGFFIEHYWIVEWDLTGREPYVQETLPHPCVHLVFEKDASAIFGVMRGKFSRLLRGKGRVFGVKFRPGGFYPFFRQPVAKLTDDTICPHKVFGTEVEELEEKLLSLEDAGEMVEAAEVFLRDRMPERDETVEVVGRVVECTVSDREIVRVEDVADRLNLNKRTLQRIFNKYVGVSPKWVIRRYRLHEAADRLAEGGAVNWPEMALDLGYFDQAHFIKDFKAVVGKAPAEYARNIVLDT